jgi:hypothetical protein
MTGEEIRGWAAIVLGAIATLGVAWIAARAAWKNSRKSTEEQAAMRREPSWTELVGENRSLRKDLTDLSKEFDSYKKHTDEAIDKLEDNNRVTARREVLLYWYTRTLRDHVTGGFPPPPPEPPVELSDWFDRFEETAPSGLFR